MLPASAAAGPPHSQFVAKTALGMKMAIRPARPFLVASLSLSLSLGRDSRPDDGWRIDSGGASRGAGE